MSDPESKFLPELLAELAGVIGLIAVGVMSLIFGLDTHNGEKLHAAACFAVSAVSFGLLYCWSRRKK